MSKGCLYSDLDNLRTEYRIKSNEYAKKLKGPLKARARILYEKKLYDYQLSYEKIDKLLHILPSLEL